MRCLVSPRPDSNTSHPQSTVDPAQDLPRAPHTFRFSFVASSRKEVPGSDHEPLDLILQRADLAHEIAGLVGRDTAADDGATDAAGAA